MKRIFDFTISFFGLIFLSPLLLIFMFLIWWQDNRSPFYIALRTGKNERPFKMIKLRSMIVDADKSGVDSTSNTDSRITRVGQIVRKYKIDELTQLWNVLLGDMSLVGPRPNVKRETDLYTEKEKKLLMVRPGITDIASIVFSDEGEILSGNDDPDLAYHQLVRPGKGHLGLFYVENESFFLDLKLIGTTVLAVISKQKALDVLKEILRQYGASKELIEIVSRKNVLVPSPPLGSKNIVTARDRANS